MDQSRALNLTYKVNLPGGQTRLQEAALYVMKKCERLPHFGLTKLNKILWKADFEAFAGRRTPVTGRQYQRLKNGPAPVEMRPLLDEMLRHEYIRIEERAKGAYIESRPIALVDPSMRYFSADDLSFLDGAIEAYTLHTGGQVSRDSHGVAWATRQNGDAMPYELSLLSDEPLNEFEVERFATLGRERGWRSH